MVLEIPLSETEFLKVAVLCQYTVVNIKHNPAPTNDLSGCLASKDPEVSNYCVLV